MPRILANVAQDVHGAGPRTKDLYEAIPTCIDMYIANSQHNLSLPFATTRPDATKAPPTHPTSNPTPNSPTPKPSTSHPLYDTHPYPLPSYIAPTNPSPRPTPLPYPHRFSGSTHSRPSSLTTHSTANPPPVYQPDQKPYGRPGAWTMRQSSFGDVSQASHVLSRSQTSSSSRPAGVLHGQRAQGRCGVSVLAR
jgi:hypothetical protein